MKRFYTAESVTEGHPDKLCDLIADSILDECLREDSSSKVACEVMAAKGNLFVAGEITSRHEPDAAGIAKKVLEEAGYSAENIKITVQLHKQSPDIAGAVRGPHRKGNGAYGKETWSGTSWWKNY